MATKLKTPATKRGVAQKGTSAPKSGAGKKSAAKIAKKSAVKPKPRPAVTSGC
jgi:hypothetical protein